MGKKDSNLSSEVLCRVKSPLYSISILTSRHFVCAGGGGSAKTGIKNGMEVFELFNDDGLKTQAKSVAYLDTGEYAIMNSTTLPLDSGKTTCVIAAGNDEMCQLYNYKMTRKPEGEIDTNSDIYHQISRLSTCVKADSGSEDGYQKAVAFSMDGERLATGGSSGVLRIWNFGKNDHSLSLLHEINAHTRDVDDICFSMCGEYLASVGKDYSAFVWDVLKGRKHTEMGWNCPKDCRYNFKRIKFSILCGNSKKPKVFTICNPVGSTKLPGYLMRWDGKTFLLDDKVASDKRRGGLSALAVSHEGDFVSTGSMLDGSVQIYTSHNLQILRSIEKCHSTFITGLQFVPQSSHELLTCFSECSVISISVDSQISLHHVFRPKPVYTKSLYVFVILSMILVFTISTYIDSVL